MATTFAWFVVIVDSMMAIVFLTMGHVTRHRPLMIAGAALMGTAVMMLSAVTFNNPDLVLLSYALGGSACFMGLVLLVRSSKP